MVPAVPHRSPHPATSPLWGGARSQLAAEKQQQRPPSPPLPPSHSAAPRARSGQRQAAPASLPAGSRTPPGRAAGRGASPGRSHQTRRLAPGEDRQPGRGRGAGRREGDAGDSPLLAVAMCPRSRRPCAKLQRHGQEAILRGRRRAPELGREPAGLGRGGQSRGGRGGQPLPPAGSRSQLSTTDATARHGCNSGTAPAQIYRGGACLQLRGVRQPGFGQRRAARQGLRPALPRGAMGAGRAGAVAGRAHEPTASPSQPQLLLRRLSGTQPSPAREREDSQPGAAARTQPLRLPATSTEQSEPCASVSPFPPCEGSGSHQAGEALQAASNSVDPKPRPPQTPFPRPASTAPVGRATLSRPAIAASPGLCSPSSPAG